MNSVPPSFDSTSSDSFLAYVQQQESLPDGAVQEDERYEHLSNETRQCPWKDMHYKRSLAQYIKKKYKKSVKVTNQFAERTYRDFYKTRILENQGVSRYLKVKSKKYFYDI